MSYGNELENDLQRGYLIAERKEREELTAKFVDESYVWEGGF